jgi:glycerophosphoryl diester phosphodiesterase
MEKIKKLWKLTVGQFWHSRWAFSRVYLVITILASAVAVPVLKGLIYVGQWLDDVPYLSLSNLGQIVLQNPIFDGFLVLTIILVLLAFGWQLGSYVIGFSAIHAGDRPTALSVIKVAWQHMWHLGLGRGLLVAFYGVIVLPFPMLTFHSIFTTDLKIPAFVVPTITATPWMWLSLVALALVALLLAVRWFYVLPEMLLANHSAKAAIQTSWAKTRGRAGWRLLLFLFGASIMVGFLTLLGFGVAWLAQLAFDQLGSFDISLLAAIVTFIVATLSDIFFSIVSLQFIIGRMTAGYQTPTLVDFTAKPRRTKRWVGVFLILNLIAQGAGPSFWFVINTTGRNMTTLSHRGVDGDNGVQNTIPAMQATVATAHPDYVEMDIRQTKDGKWAVMHDPTLTTLTKGASDKSISELTLAEATSLTVYENGHSAKIPSFADYAAAAEKLGVKLLVEIKTERTTAPDLADSFLKQYKATMANNNWRMHSLNYSVVQRLKTLDSKLKVGMILPGDFVGNPVTKADFYTMEYSYLTQSQVEDFNEYGKSVYAWTVNDETRMVSAYAQGVQGEITDNISDLKSVMQESNAAKMMHQKLGLYILNVLAQ